MDDQFESYENDISCLICLSYDLKFLPISQN